MATLKDVAKLAHVDVSTVSRALNNTSYVHPETRERIFAAVKELSYHPNVAAKALREGKRHTVGVVVPRLQMTVFSEILHGIEEQAAELGYGTLVSVTRDDPDREKESLNRLRSGFVDGIIVAATGRNGRILRGIQAGGIPVTQLIRRQELELSSVIADYEATGYDAVKFLCSKGCRKIGLIAGALHLAPYRGRYEGYCRAVRELGLEEIAGDSKHDANTFRYGYECALQLLEEYPDLDAIIAAVDIQGLGAIRAATENGLKIPEDIKVISLTGHRVGQMLETTMTSLEIPAFEIGQSAAKLTIDYIEAPSEQKPARRHLVFAPTLVEREST